ncbi:YciK family oxidoreductase [Paraferrimonas sedimenticola]|uniref:YciK family oxidoreductase n=1 Tax=Paraferrimonas sedimenticola TaxID=375674 RepID=A0AA37W043_9GAMM|nr:YciK family oxidoreductase [Paraferrimonas sedimenticola]GLP94918.1 YciK family oxidoreductase [Paraferrimonas sedimenticola]
MDSEFQSAYSFEPQCLTGKTILITGAGDGIGRQAAKSFAEHGATVILLGKTTAKLEAVYDEIVEAGYPQPAIVPMDLKGAEESHYQGLAETIESQFKGLDGLLHNASLLGTLGPFEHISLEQFDEVMQVNLRSQFMLTKALLPVLKQADKASIVFTSSGVGKKGRAYWGSYAISKFATEGMMQTLADELDGSNLRANSINPGATRTSMRASAFPAEDPMTLPTAADLMPAYLYLMSDASADNNGQAYDAQAKA